MKHFLLLFAFLLLVSPVVLAQEAAVPADTTWRRSFSSGLNVNQAAFSDNWKAGGVSSIALNTFLNARAQYKKGPHSWDNDFQLQYGLLKNKGEGMRKSQDRLYFDSKYGRSFSTDWNIFASLNFLSQLAQGFEYDAKENGGDRLISSFLSPGFLTLAVGAEYKPTPNFSLRLSPLAPRLTFLIDDKVAQNERYGVPEGDVVRTELLAAMVQADYDKEIATNMRLKLNYMAFLNYKRFAFKNVDHRLNLSLTAKVNKYINVSLMGNALYDRDQDGDVQYSQSLGLGVMYTLQGFTVN
ncbi:DUF3078 domain-containing protein [Rufibacter sp. LB8]|uniref:DUF3078 domain-containing protein n=1 Tax=Rufibacter sp. LB8 TaxID=2777781 RepID=UPI00178C563B|nr:DUF3078 domain-containing protein [Rufibacter sp. LB8]